MSSGLAFSAIEFWPNSPGIAWPKRAVDDTVEMRGQVFRLRWWCERAIDSVDDGVDGAGNGGLPGVKQPGK